MTKRSVLILAVFATLGAAFRQNIANIVKLDAEVVAEPPDVEGLMSQAASVIDAKIEAAAARLSEAQQSMMALSTAVAGQNNTNKGMSAHEAVDAMMKANQDKAAATAVKEKIKLMVEACTTLFGAVQSFKANAEPRAALEHQQAAEELNSKLDGLKAATVAAEKLDLSNLLKLIADIREAQARVDKLDAQVGAGAAAGIDGATALVYAYASQLEQRQSMLTSASAFSAFPPLEPADGLLKIDALEEKKYSECS